MGKNIDNEIVALGVTSVVCLASAVACIAVSAIQQRRFVKEQKKNNTKKVHEKVMNKKPVYEA